MQGADKEFFDEPDREPRAGICGRGMYEAAGAWGGTNPFGGRLFVVTHRTEDAPDASTGFTFVDGFAEALAAAQAEAGDRAVSIAGGADVIRQALDAGVVDELAVSVAPVVLSVRASASSTGFTRDLDLEILSVHHSAYAVHTTYGVLR